MLDSTLTYRNCWLSFENGLTHYIIIIVTNKSTTHTSERPRIAIELQECGRRWACIARTGRASTSRCGHAYIQRFSDSMLPHYLSLYGTKQILFITGVIPPCVVVALFCKSCDNWRVPYKTLWFDLSQKIFTPMSLFNLVKMYVLSPSSPL